MLRDRKDVRPVGLAVPARDARETMRDVLDLDVERGGVEQIEPAARQHALPGARRVARAVAAARLRIARSCACELARTPRDGGT